MRVLEVTHVSLCGQEIEKVVTKRLKERTKATLEISTIYRLQMRGWHGNEYLRQLRKKRTEMLRVRFIIRTLIAVHYMLHAAMLRVKSAG